MNKAFGLIGQINAILDIEWDNFISFQKVLEWGLNEKRVIEGVINLKILHTKTHCRFLTAIPPGASFNIHWHDCTEICMVLVGVLGDKEKDKVFRIGEACTYKAFEKHIPHNPSDKEYLYLIVDFYK